MPILSEVIDIGQKVVSLFKDPGKDAKDGFFLLAMNFALQHPELNGPQLYLALNDQNPFTSSGTRADIGQKVFSGTWTQTIAALLKACQDRGQIDKSVTVEDLTKNIQAAKVGMASGSTTTTSGQLPTTVSKDRLTVISIAVGVLAIVITLILTLGRSKTRRR